MRANHRIVPVLVPVLGLSVVFTSAIGGCGGVHGIPIDKTASDIAQAVCMRAWECCTADQLMNNDKAGADEVDCKAKTAESFRDLLSSVQRSEDQRRAQYIQSKVDACLGTLRSSTCESLNTTNHLSGVPGCETFVIPLVQVGGACGNDYECIDSFCKREEGQFGDGVCTLPATPGQSCAADHCASGLSCDPKGSNDDHSDDVCVQPQEIGATCTDAYECKSSNCSSSGGSGLTCQPAPPSGAKCFYGSGCSAAGDGAPGAATILLLGLFVVIALARAKRRARGD